MTVPADLKTLLLGAGLTDIVNGQMPHSPDAVVMTRMTGGLDALETHGGEVYDRPRVQIIVRAATFAVAWANATIAIGALRKRNVDVNGSRYLSIVPIDTLQDLGKDMQKPGRHEVSFNIQIVVGV